MKIILSSLCNEKIFQYFDKKGIVIIRTMPFCSGKNPVLLHPDIQCFYENKTLFTTKKLNLYYKQFYSKIIVSDIELSPKYPKDILFNCLKIENNVFCFEKYTDKKLLNVLSENYNIHNVNQGYSNCSSLYLGKNTIVTSDNGMVKVFEKLNYDVILIDNSTIKLSGYKNGFIGGSAVRLKDEIVFFGNISNDTSLENIKMFLDKNEIKYKNFDFPLEDFGSGILTD